MRQLDKPNWYLPNWGNTRATSCTGWNSTLCFMNNLQGLAKSPDPVMNAPYAAATSPSIVETNKLGLRLGTIFSTMRPSRGDVAVLYSLSQCLDAEIKSGMKDNYLGGGLTRGRLLTVYFASKMIHIPFTPVVEEDVLDGSRGGRLQSDRADEHRLSRTQGRRRAGGLRGRRRPGPA